MSLRRYPCTVTRVIDGDTLVASLDLGLGFWLRDQHCRLDGIDTPELRDDDAAMRKRAEEARDILSGLILFRDGATMDTDGRRDKYGRILGVFRVPGITTTVQQRLIEMGVGRVYDGRSKR